MDPFGISPKQLRERFGRRSQERRLALNQSQASVAAKAGVSVTTLKRFEAGENVSVDVLIRVAQALDAAAPLSALFPQLEARSIRDLVDENIRRQRGRRGP
jgi:transcriptional regulator with XRE-family HTH domain